MGMSGCSLALGTVQNPGSGFFVRFRLVIVLPVFL